MHRIICVQAPLFVPWGWGRKAALALLPGGCCHHNSLSAHSHAASGTFVFLRHLVVTGLAFWWLRLIVSASAGSCGLTGDLLALKYVCRCFELESFRCGCLFGTSFRSTRNRNVTVVRRMKSDQPCAGDNGSSDSGIRAERCLHSICSAIRSQRSGWETYSTHRCVDQAQPTVTLLRKRLAKSR